MHRSEPLPGRAKRCLLHVPAGGRVPADPDPGVGAHYDLDLVRETVHRRYDMHEYARIDGPDGSIWFAKDALVGNQDSVGGGQLDMLHRRTSGQVVG